MRGYNEVLEVGSGWKWHNELTIRLPDGNDVHFHHGKSANIMAVGQKAGYLLCARTLSYQVWHIVLGQPQQPTMVYAGRLLDR